MAASTVAALAVLLLVWATVSAALARSNVTGPMLFAAAGWVLANPDWGPLPLDVRAGDVQVVAEVTLALVLFSDASRVNVRRIRRDLGVPARLLGIGLPLSVALGGLLAAWLLDDLTWALAGFVGAALAPTDAALSVQVITDERVPGRVRRALNVESGLNDGIATPIVGVMLAVAAGELSGSDGGTLEVGTAFRELGLGVVLGLAVGVAAATMLAAASRRAWTTTGGRQIATLGTAVAAYATSVMAGGNGFISAFVAGAAFGAVLTRSSVDVEQSGELPELGGELLALVVWFLFGAALVPVALGVLDVPLLLYALLSLTVVRLLPVGVASAGSGLDGRTVLFLGWFGPRGLASVVFALLAVDALGTTGPVERAVGAVALTVLLSVVLHGVTAGPLGRRYARSAEVGHAARNEGAVAPETDTSSARDEAVPARRSHAFSHRTGRFHRPVTRSRTQGGGP